MKLTLTNIFNFFIPSTITAFNANNDAIAQAVEDTLSKSGAGNNAMTADLDMNGNHIINLPPPESDNEPVPFSYLKDVTDQLDDLTDTVSNAEAVISGQLVQVQTASVKAVASATAAGVSATAAANSAAQAAANVSGVTAQYVDTRISTQALGILAGSNPVVYNAQNTKILNLAPGALATDAASIQSIIDRALNYSSGLSAYDAATKAIKRVGNPVDGTDAANANYVSLSIGAQAVPKLAIHDEAGVPQWRIGMTAFRNLDYHFWDPTRNNGDSNYPGAVRPVDTYGLINNGYTTTNAWAMFQYVNLMYWHWRITRSEITRQKIFAQAKWFKLVYTQAQRQSANNSNNNSLVKWSDDAMWLANGYMQFFEITGDRVWMTDSKALIQSARAVFADPNNSGSPYGIYYASASQVAAGDDGGHGRVSTSYEAGMAAAAMRIWTESNDNDMLGYASSTRDHLKQYFFHPTGYLYCEFDLDPSHADNGNDQGYLKAKGRAFGAPVRSNSASFSGGTLMYAVLCARLYRYSGNTSYLTEAQNVATNFVKTNAFVRTNLVSSGLFLNERDSWNEGYWYPYFVDECLTLPGVDTTGVFKTVLNNTALYVDGNQKTSDGYYKADWSGDEWTNYPATTGQGPNWETQAGTGSTPGFARSDQIMTSSSTATLMLAAAILNQSTRRDTF